jgi:hypothetical protein
MLFMVVETFKNPNLVEVRQRFQSEGRLMPEGLVYVSSWMTIDGSQCYQLIETPTLELLDIWISNWSDLVDFEVTQLETSTEFWAKRHQG